MLPLLLKKNFKHIQPHFNICHNVFRKKCAGQRKKLVFIEMKYATLYHQKKMDLLIIN